MCQGCNTKMRQVAIVWLVHRGKANNFHYIISGLNRNTIGSFEPIGGGGEAGFHGIKIKGKHPTLMIDSSSFLNGTLSQLTERQFLCKSGGEIYQKFPCLWEYVKKINAKKSLMKSHECLLSLLDLNLAMLAARRFSQSNCLFSDNLLEDNQSSFSETQIQNWRGRFLNTSDILPLVMEARNLILSSVMHNFVSYCMDNFYLSPLHCISLPSYSVNVMMYNSNSQYEHIR